jgi:hydroxymethylbilane synthase
VERLVLGTRGSPLALWQARHVSQLLTDAHADVEVELLVIKTEGDRRTGVPLDAVGGKGLFVREIEDALLDGRIDLAVHSLKDLPTEQPPRLTIGAVLLRHDPRDAVLSVEGRAFEDLPEGSTVATGSPRRRCQLLHARPDLLMAPVRGNVDTRVRKLVDGSFKALVLALAGIERLGVTGAPARPIAPEICLPAVGQGALAVETRQDDARTRARVEPLTDDRTLRAVSAERAYLRRLGGGCLAPATAFARVDDGRVRLQAMVGDPDGRRMLRDSAAGAAIDAEALAERLAERLLEAGGEGILRDARAGGGFGG